MVIEEEIKQNEMKTPPASAPSSKIWTKYTSHIATVCPGGFCWKDTDCILTDVVGTENRETWVLVLL